MKKRVLLILLAVLMTLGAVLGCADRYPEVDVNETPDKNYAVTSNGGMVVQKGDFIYFINGYKSVVDLDGKNNVWGKVEKGGIYYAKLTEGKSVQVSDYYGQYITYDNSENNLFDEEFSGFVTENRTYKDENDEEQTKQQIAVKPVVSKLITNGGYENGGLYIIDDYIYYATPTTKKNKKGEVQYNLVDFFRTRIDGKGTQYLYTSKDANAKPVYGYYKYNDSVYAVFYEPSQQKIYSVQITKNKVKKPVVLAEKVTSAILPQKSVYYEGISQDMPEDYIYYTRDIDIKTDTESEGNILERVRPNGSERKKILSGVDIILDKVYNGHLFYYVDGFKSSANKHYFAKDLTKEGEPVSIFYEPSDSFPVNVYGLVVYENDLLALATKGSSTVLYIAGENAGKVVLNKKSIILYADENNAYFVEDTSEGDQKVTDAELLHINFFANMYSESQKIAEANIKANFLKVDVAAGYIFYISTANEIVQTINKDGEDVTVLAETDYYVRLQHLSSPTNVEWDMGWLDKMNYPKNEDKES